MTGSLRSQLCSPGAAVSSLAFVLVGGEVPPLPRRLLAFLSPTELLRPRNAGEAAGFSPETGGPRASFPGPQPQLPLPAVPQRSSELNEATLEQTLASAQTGSRDREKEKPNTLRQTAPLGRRLGTRCPSGKQQLYLPETPGCLQSKDHGGFCGTAPGQEMSTDNRLCARLPSGPVLS